MALRAPKRYIWKTQHLDPVTRHNPQTLLWALSCGNYFLFYQTTHTEWLPCTDGSVDLLLDERLMFGTKMRDINAALLGWTAALASFVSLISLPLIQEWMQTFPCAVNRKENSSYVKLKQSLRMILSSRVMMSGKRFSCWVFKMSWVKFCYIYEAADISSADISKSQQLKQSRWINSASVKS